MKKQRHTVSENFVFVIQKHATVRPHFDLRLQVNDTMPSWSIPKGPTLDPTVKRLAMETSDHSLEYRNFEGVIPQGEYGAGAVMIWDEGIYIPEREITKGVREEVSDIHEAQKIMNEELQKGEIKFILQGKKLKGSFALIKTHGFGPKNSWLLIKHKDSFCISGYDANTYNTSARSNRTMDEIVTDK